MKETPAERMTREFIALRDSIADTGVDYFDLSHPGMWFCEGGEWTEHPHTYGDVYLLIRGFALSASRNDDFAHLDGITLVTCGWAAPLPVEWNGDDDDSAIGRPSEHPEKVRCALVMTIARDGSVYSHLDVQGRETSGESYGRGGLLDALDYLGVGVWKREYTQGVLAWYADLRAQADAAGDVLDDHITRFFAERIAGMMAILGHDTDAPDSALS